MQSLRGILLNVGGDGRCCSPGHTAKFGSYSVMDLNTSKILDVRLTNFLFANKTEDVREAG